MKQRICIGFGVSRRGHGCIHVDYSRKIYLIVDDFYEFRRSVKQMLTELGAKVIESVDDAEKALGLARRKHFDVIICDYNLGESKDGQELHEQLVAEGAIDSSTAFLIVTAEDTTAMVVASLECEPDAYRTKPFSKPVLANRLERVLLKKDLLADVLKAMENRRVRIVVRH